MEHGRAVGKVSRNVESTLDTHRQLVTAEELKSKKNRGGSLGGRVQKVCLIVGHRDGSQVDARHPAQSAQPKSARGAKTAAQQGFSARALLKKRFNAWFEQSGSTRILEMRAAHGLLRCRGSAVSVTRGGQHEH